MRGSKVWMELSHRVCLLGGRVGPHAPALQSPTPARPRATTWSCLAHHPELQQAHEDTLMHVPAIFLYRVHELVFRIDLLSSASIAFLLSPSYIESASILVVAALDQSLNQPPPSICPKMLRALLLLPNDIDHAMPHSFSASRSALSPSTSTHQPSWPRPPSP